MAWYGKVYEVFKSPITVAITLTCPIVSYDEEVNHNWNKYLQCLQMFCAPILCCMLTKVGFNSVVGSFQVYMLMFIVGTCLSLLIFFTSKPEVKPIYHAVFGYVAFVISLNWIYVIANEIVAILETFGVVFNISNAILGLTLLAWGNSIGDWISNSVMARQGFARMGFAACFGAPLFNLCLGFGIPLMIQMISKQETSIKVTLTPVTMVLGMFLLTSVRMSLVFLPILKFKVNRYYGIILLLLYIVFLVTILLTETKVILGGFEIPKVPKPDL